MEAIILMGLQAAGKSTFYQQRFFSTHVRISLDLLRTRNRERRLLELCCETGQPFVVDNTNPTAKDREKYIELAKQHQFGVCGFYFQSRLSDCLKRNSNRDSPVPDAGLFATSRKFELPQMNERFDQLFYVQLDNQQFLVEEWKDEV